MQPGLIGEHPLIKHLRSKLAQYADLDFPVLIQGESGSGKEIAASHHLHRQSKRHAAPLLILNCSTLTAPLIESTLFGHTRGAFTGAIRDQAGYFSEVGNGTLFLDEIGELPIELQGKLLRVLENGEYQRLGETHCRQSTARIVAATNRNLRHDICTGRFRADLYHRLSVLTVHLPPLRERGDDRELLLEHFRRQLSKQTGRPAIRLDRAATQLWQSYAFPGNVRELHNIVTRLTAHHCGPPITHDELLSELVDYASLFPHAHHLLNTDTAHKEARQTLHHHGRVDLNAILAQCEADYIQAALEMANGNLSQAARRLGLNRTTLYNRIQARARR